MIYAMMCFPVNAVLHTDWRGSAAERTVPERVEHLGPGPLWEHRSIPFCLRYFSAKTYACVGVLRKLSKRLLSELGS